MSQCSQRPRCSRPLVRQVPAERRTHIEGLTLKIVDILFTETAGPAEALLTIKCVVETVAQLAKDGDFVDVG